MKVVVSFLFVLLSFASFSQEENKETYFFHEDELYEKARFEAKNKELNTYYSDVEVYDVAITPNVLNNLKYTMYNKEGIFKLELLEEGKRLRVYHMEYIERETIKLYVERYVEKFDIHEAILFYLP